MCEGYGHLKSSHWEMLLWQEESVKLLMTVIYTILNLSKVRSCSLMFSTQDSYQEAFVYEKTMCWVGQMTKDIPKAVLLYIR